MPWREESYYSYMIGGVQRTSGFYSNSVENALAFVETMTAFLDVASGHRPKKENLQAWNPYTGDWEQV